MDRKALTVLSLLSIVPAANAINAHVSVPLSKNPNMATFVQLGIDFQKKTTTLGVVQRHNVGDWFLGYNSFIDDGIRTRWGVGLEAATQHFSLAANSYLPISGWRDSTEFEGFRAAPARGYDVRAKFHMPDFPQLCGAVSYERFEGSKTHLIDKHGLPCAPSTISVGASYTPVPLITLSVEHKRNDPKHNNNMATVGFRYVFGVPLEQQMSTPAVSKANAVDFSSFTPVNRSTQIVANHYDKDTSPPTTPPADSLLTTTVDSDSSTLLENQPTQRAATNQHCQVGGACDQKTPRSSLPRYPDEELTKLHKKRKDAFSRSKIAFKEFSDSGHDLNSSACRRIEEVNRELNAISIESRRYLYRDETQ